MKILVGIYCLIVLGLFTGVVLIAGSANYRAPTPHEIGKNYSQKSFKAAVQALEYAKIAGMIEESMRCPCYDIQVSTDDYQTILRVDKEGCKE